MAVRTIQKLSIIILLFICIRPCLAIVESSCCLQTPLPFQQAMQIWEKRGLEIKGFDHWIFNRGGLFAAGSIWWKTKHHYHRPVPHEGVDFYFYQVTNSDTVKHLQAMQAIPLIYPGKLISTFKDFIGETYVFETSIVNAQGLHFYVLYAHIRPINLPSADLDHLFPAGAKLFTINTQQKTYAPSHLHISTFWAPPTLKPTQISWASIDSSKEIIIVNPLFAT